MNYSSTKKRAILFMALILILSTFGTSFASGSFTDLKDSSWAQQTIEKWAGYGLVNGFVDGTFKPMNAMSRAEFAVIAYKAFDLDSKLGSSFSDVPKSAWYYNEVTKIAKLGFMTGKAAGIFDPKANITRSEVAVILANIQGLTANEEGAKIFTDFEAIPVWARGHVGASAMAKFISGYSDSSFKGSKTITRAEAVAMLDNTIYGANAFANNWKVVVAGTYGGTVDKPVIVKGNVIIKTPGAILKNLVIEGNLVFGKEIGEGEATLDGVVVKGNTTVLGGGVNSIYFKNTTLQKVYIIKENNTIRIVAQGSTNIASLIAQSGVELEEIDLVGGAGFTEVIGDMPAGTKIILDGDFGDIKVTSANIIVEVTPQSVVKNLVLTQATTVTGTGTITKATISSSGITFAKAPTTVAQTGTTVLTITVAGKAQEVPVTPAPVVTPPATGGGSTGGGTTPPPAPVKTNYDFLVLKQTGYGSNPAYTMQWVRTMAYVSTDKINFGMVEDVYADMPYIPSYATSTITDILQLKNASNIEYITVFNNKLKAMNTSGLKVFNDADLKEAINDLGSDPSGDYGPVAATIMQYKLSDILADLAVIFPTENVSSQIKFSFLEADGAIHDYLQPVKVSDLYNLVVAKLGNYSIDEVVNLGGQVIGVRVKDTSLSIVIGR